jgi:murein DD-endopeptidase MepM/ murein hydrolase activator NlpD/tetratricopeptide (TPR) repeat protein
MSDLRKDEDLQAVEQLDDKSREQWLNLSAQTALAIAGGAPSQANADLIAAAEREAESPAAPAYRLWAGDNLAREGRFQEAVKTYDVAVDVALSSRRLHPDVNPTSCSLRHKAQAAGLAGDSKLAVRTYRELANVSADGAEPLFLAGTVAERDRNDAEAADLYRVAAAKAPSRKTDNPAELARRALLRLEDSKTFYLRSAESLADFLIRCLETGDTEQLDRCVSRTHFAAGPLGGHTAFEEPELLGHLYRDLSESSIESRRKLLGSGDKLYLLTSGWRGEWFRDEIVFLLTRAPKGWQWTGVAISQPNDLWMDRWRPAVKETNQPLPFTLLAPWPAPTSFMAGGLGDFAAKQAAILAAGPIGFLLAAKFAESPCGFGARGFYYNQGPTHDEEEAFAIDFTRYRTNVPYDNESGGTPVLAARGGIVVRVIFDRANGDPTFANEVQITHADPANPSDTSRFRSRYMHMEGPSRLAVSPLMAVIAGQRLGLMDDTGNSVLDHPHFSIHDRNLPHPKVSFGRSVRPTPMSGVTLGDGGSATCVKSTNFERSPGLNFRPGSISFSLVRIGDTEQRTLTIENTLGFTVTASFPASTSGPFRWSAFNQSIPNDQKRTVTINFTPTATTLASKTLSVTSTAPGSPHAIRVSGFGRIGVED